MCFFKIYFSHLKPFIYCLKLFKIHDIKKNNNNADPRNEKIGIAEELLKLMKSLTDWQKPANYKYRDAISPAALHAIVCKIKPRYKLVIYNKANKKISDKYIYYMCVKK